MLGVKQPPPPERLILTPAEARALIDAATAYVRTFVMLAVGTLARPQAILDLTWFEVDLERRLINFNQAGRVQSRKRRPVCRSATTCTPT